MKTLEQIQDEVGKEIFTRWKQRANSLLIASPYRFKEAEAQHAFIYEDITRRYKDYVKVYDHHEPRIREALRTFSSSINNYKEVKS